GDMLMSSLWARFMGSCSSMFCIITRGSCMVPGVPASDDPGNLIFLQTRTGTVESVTGGHKALPLYLRKSRATMLQGRLSPPRLERNLVLNPGERLPQCSPFSPVSCSYRFIIYRPVVVIQHRNHKQGVNTVL